MVGHVCVCVLAEIINGPSGGNSEMGDGPDAGAIMTISLCVCVMSLMCPSQFTPTQYEKKKKFPNQSAKKTRGS